MVAILLTDGGGSLCSNTEGPCPELVTKGNVQLEDVTCHSIFCRTRMPHTDPSTRRDDIHQLLMTPKLRHQMVTYAPQGDKGRTVMYFAREVISSPF